MHTLSFRIPSWLLSVVLLLVACQPIQAPVAMTTEVVDVAPLLGNLGDHTHPITTKSALAQKYFDEGLILTFGFNHAEAIRSYNDALKLDPDCAMCYWGIAYALGPNINRIVEGTLGTSHPNHRKPSAQMATPYYNCRWSNDKYMTFFTMEYPNIE